MQYAVAVLDATHLGGNQLQHRPFRLDRIFERCEEFRIDPVGNESADLPAGEGFGTVLDDAQRADVMSLY